MCLLSVFLDEVNIWIGRVIKMNCLVYIGMFYLKNEGFE